MKAFHQDEQIKSDTLIQIRGHRAADEIVKGKYWQDGKGCAVGCTVHSGEHGDYETKLGIPRILARLEDGIFEGLPNAQAMTWPERFIESIAVGADLSMVWPKFAVWLLTDPAQGVIRFAKTDQQREAIQRVSDLYQKTVNGEAVPKIDFRKAAAAADADAAAADAAAASAAYASASDASDAYASAAYAAYASAASAAYAAYAYAAYAADAAACAAAASAAARRTARVAQSERLIELLKEAK